jgi:hypothetical protein
MEEKGQETLGEGKQHHHYTKPEQVGVKNAEWELHHHCPHVR